MHARSEGLSPDGLLGESQAGASGMTLRHAWLWTLCLSQDTTCPRQRLGAAGTSHFRNQTLGLSRRPGPGAVSWGGGTTKCYH